MRSITNPEGANDAAEWRIEFRDIHDAREAFANLVAGQSLREGLTLRWADEPQSASSVCALCSTACTAVRPLTPPADASTLPSAQSIIPSLTSPAVASVASAPTTQIPLPPAVNEPTVGASSMRSFKKRILLEVASGPSASDTSMSCVPTPTSLVNSTSGIPPPDTAQFQQQQSTPPDMLAAAIHSSCMPQPFLPPLPPPLTPPMSTSPPHQPPPPQPTPAVSLPTPTPPGSTQQLPMSRQQSLANSTLDTLHTLLATGEAAGSISSLAELAAAAAAGTLRDLSDAQRGMLVFFHKINQDNEARSEA